MPLQDWEDAGGGLLLGCQRVRTHRHREILCREGHKQANDAGKRAHGMLSAETTLQLPATDADPKATQVRNEIAVLKRVSMGHQNILTLVDYFETMNNRMSAVLCSIEQYRF